MKHIFKNVSNLLGLPEISLLSEIRINLNIYFLKLDVKTSNICNQNYFFKTRLNSAINCQNKCVSYLIKGLTCLS